MRPHHSTLGDAGRGRVRITCALVALTILGPPGCAHRVLPAKSGEVARALGDRVELTTTFDPANVPKLDAPQRLRPCCAFGEDLRVKVGPVPIAFVEQPNMRGPSELGPHGYDRGKREHNGLVYTCRGGFIDTAHLRENADRTLYLTTEIVRALPEGQTLELPAEGTLRRVRIRPLPPGLLAAEGRWATATAIAQWINYQLSIWHEVITWYGWESVPGTPERLSSFSPEDLYSNVLGGHLAAGIAVNGEARTRDEYERSMASWIKEALRRLGAVEREDARAAMAAVDGIWWDSRERVPDMRLVLRRNLETDGPLAGWIVDDALGDAGGPAIAAMCEGQPPPLRLRVPETIGEAAIAELVTVEFEFDRWRPADFPRPAGAGATVTQADFPAIVAAIRRAGANELGPGFDQSKPEPAAPQE